MVRFAFVPSVSFTHALSPQRFSRLFFAGRRFFFLRVCVCVRALCLASRSGSDSCVAATAPARNAIAYR